MAAKGPKVKELAWELGVTSRRILECCRAEGLVVQNSLTRLAPEAAQAVRRWFKAWSEDDTGRCS